MTRYCILDSPVGDLLLVCEPDALVEIRFSRGSREFELGADWREGGGVLDRAAAQLEQYFLGRRTEFDLPLTLGGTKFQREVWRELQRIPYGGVLSYGELARRIGKPTASRAVGAANGKNPLPIVVPCHRVVGSTGALVGFGGGVSRKEHLLRLESRVLGGRRPRGRGTNRYRAAATLF